MMKTFTCPKCGGTLQYGETKDILSCPYCGAAVEKETDAVEKIINYKERKAQRDLDEKKRQEKRANEGAHKLLIMFVILIAAYFVVHYLGIK